jgi:hypothetical protein
MNLFRASVALPNGLTLLSLRVIDRDALIPGRIKEHMWKGGSTYSSSMTLPGYGATLTAIRRMGHSAY